MNAIAGFDFLLRVRLLGGFRVFMFGKPLARRSRGLKIFMRMAYLEKVLRRVLRVPFLSIIVDVRDAKASCISVRPDRKVR